MRTRVVHLLVLALVAGGLAGCCQGPGHTRALGTIAGTVAGAALGAAVSPCYPGGGALAGGALGMMVGSAVGDGIACDQARCGPPPCRPRCQPCDPCGPQVGQVVSRRVVRRRVYVVEGGVRRPAEEIVEEEIIEEDPCFGFGGR